MSNLSSGVDSLNLVGKIDVTSNKRNTRLGLSQVIDAIQGKTNEVTIPHAGSAGSPVTVPLNFSSGVSEALCLVLMCDLPIVVTLTSSDSTNPGPMSMGLKGVSILTLTPSEGIRTITAYNSDPNNDATLEMAVVALAASTDQPTFWFPPQQS